MVFGALGRYQTEELYAKVILKDADTKISALEAYCREHLADYKQPVFRVVDIIGKTATGKNKRT